ncbi:MAG TPA: type II secretion system protein [Verrucomicrobiae bacterium]|nr:type II secretion system protein [Verrucomicrobiae bacterium]
MKTNQAAGMVESQELRVESKPGIAPRSSLSQPRKGAWPTRGFTPSTLNSQLAFTLVELLVVISIIAILAAFTIPALRAFKRISIINQTRAEMANLETAIESYKAAYGFYPPSNPNDARINPLYFELLGTTNNNGVYYTLDGSANISANATTVMNAFGVSGFVNVMKSGTGEDAPAARSFLSNLKPRQFISVTNNSVLATVLMAAVGGPDPNYLPFANTPDFNPWRYACPGTNNPNSYDLWVQLSIGGKTNLICNWNKTVVLNSPLP